MKKCDFCRVYPNLPFERICSAYVYEGKAKEALKRFKRERYQGYAQEFAEYLKAVVEYDCTNVKFDVVISVPPRPERMKKEGYDQARCLAKELAGRMNVTYLESVMRQKEKRAKQSGLGRAARMKNVKGNYVVRKPEEIAGKVVLLVDDICTTRATFLECAKMLKEAEAAAVYCASAATTI
ncbi:ComF family protein [Oscillospiraceae bacterium DSM 107454]|uniref:ComF family protein n=2 Tax=Ructibacterium gallinarum TaxID=2779355 RepID=A0A9D5M7N2_9FIRM|nr:ComF family protein [Ructibacterium gallinarum]